MGRSQSAIQKTFGRNIPELNWEGVHDFRGLRMRVLTTRISLARSLGFSWKELQAEFGYKDDTQKWLKNISKREKIGSPSLTIQIKEDATDLPNGILPGRIYLARYALDQIYLQDNSTKTLYSVKISEVKGKCCFPPQYTNRRE
jgi:hypothetical protein